MIKHFQVYLDWIEMVKATVPPEKLLIFNVKQGWEPLCNFLNLPSKKIKTNNELSYSEIIYVYYILDLRFAKNNNIIFKARNGISKILSSIIYLIM